MKSYGRAPTFLMATGYEQVRSIAAALAGTSKILAGAGAVSRFRSEAALASYCGVAPMEVSSGDVQRHRLSRACDRQMSYALHVMAMAKRATPGGTTTSGNEPRARPAKKPALSETAPCRCRLPDHGPRHGVSGGVFGEDSDVPGPEPKVAAGFEDGAGEDVRGGGRHRKRHVVP
jgi:hypothetical protein